MQSIIVTGASGLLGSRVASILANEGWHVYAVRRSKPSSNGSFEELEIDLSTDWNARQLPSKVDAIMHLAQSHAYRDFPGGAMDVFRVNVEATAKLLDYARDVGAQKFVYTSSGGVYGNGSRAFGEQAPLIPPGKLGYYLGSKAAGEILSQSYAAILNVTVLRPFFMYGSGQGRGMLIPRLVDSVREGRPIRIQGDSGIRINPIHVLDSATASVAALNRAESGVFNVAGPDVMSIRAICDGIGQFVGREPVFERDPGEPKDLVADISYMEAVLHRPRRRLLESLAEML